MSALDVIKLNNNETKTTSNSDVVKIKCLYCSKLPNLIELNTLT